jgi:lipopolysaccharide export system protein LptA
LQALLQLHSQVFALPIAHIAQTIAQPPAQPSPQQQPWEADDTTPQPIFLQHADSLVGGATPQGLIRELIGNVVMQQGSVNVTCERAIHYLQQNRADLLGNVVITQGSVTMKAPRGSYDGNSRLMYGLQGVYLQDRSTVLTAREGYYSTATKIARFTKTVRIETDSLIITADTLEYHRATQNSYATGRVAAAGKYTSAYLQGDSLVNLPSAHYTRVTCYALPTTATISRVQTFRVQRQPMVSQIDTVEVKKEEKDEDGGMKDEEKGKGKNMKDEKKSKPSNQAGKTSIRLDTLCITGDMLEAFRGDSANPKQEIYVATGNVKLTRGGGSKSSIAARAGKGVYEKMLDRIWVLQTPLLWLDSTQLRGDTIVIDLKEKRLERIAALRNAFSATKNDSTRQDRIDQLTGENIIVSMQQDTLRFIMAEGKAFNLYFLQSEEEGKKSPDGASRSAANTIKILFASGEADEVIWLGRVEGEQIPEHIVKKTLAQLKLKGFEWFENRPRLKRGGGEDEKPSKSTKTTTKSDTKSSVKFVKSSGIAPTIKNERQTNTVQR